MRIGSVMEFDLNLRRVRIDARRAERIGSAASAGEGRELNAAGTGVDGEDIHVDRPDMLDRVQRGNHL